MIKKIKENRVSRTYLGGGKIDKFFGKSETKNSFFPEDWTASVISAYNSSDGKLEGIGVTYEGEKITDLVGYDDFKILVKLLDSAERLVIQAHPTVQFAKEFLKSDFGKTECWYFLDCDEDACVYIGFKEGVNRKDWEDTFYNNDSEKMVSMLHKVPVKKGDFVFVDGGVPHAIGKGCFMIELQEPSDLMVVNERFTPSGREIPEKRLHMGLGFEKMFDVYDYTGYAFEEFKKKYCPEKKKIGENLYEILGEDLTDKFSMYLLIHNGELTTDKKYRIAIITGGKGTVDGLEVQKGDRVFIKDEKTVNITGDNEFEAVICE